MLAIVSFRSKALSELWEKTPTAKIDTPLNQTLPGFDFHSLRGFDPSRCTIHVNGPSCITFGFSEGDAADVDFEQYH